MGIFFVSFVLHEVVVMKEMEKVLRMAKLSKLVTLQKNRLESSLSVAVAPNKMASNVF
jgi:hypothetical protein